MSYDCQDCGACCVEPIVQIRTTGKRGHPGPCSALDGEIGVAVSCAIYQDRPRICRTFEAGSPECQLARFEAGIVD